MIERKKKKLGDEREKRLLKDKSGTREKNGRVRDEKREGQTDRKIEANRKTKRWNREEESERKR